MSNVTFLYVQKNGFFFRLKYLSDLVLCLLTPCFTLKVVMVLKYGHISTEEEHEGKANECEIKVDDVVNYL